MYPKENKKCHDFVYSYEENESRRYKRSMTNCIYSARTYQIKRINLDCPYLNIQGVGSHTLLHCSYTPMQEAESLSANRITVEHAVLYVWVGRKSWATFFHLPAFSSQELVFHIFQGTNISSNSPEYSAVLQWQTNFPSTQQAKCLWQILLEHGILYIQHAQFCCGCKIHNIGILHLEGRMFVCLENMLGNGGDLHLISKSIINFVCCQLPWLPWASIPYLLKYDKVANFIKLLWNVIH